MNHYETLGVGSDADTAQIRRAYLDKARTHHPDFHVHAAPHEQAEHARRMQVLNEAWEVLGDDDARQSYDLSFRQAHIPPTERIRPGQRPDLPKGRSWTPRRDDNGWMDDFGRWRDEDGRLAEDPPGPGRKVALTLPVLLLGVAIAAAFVGLAVDLRPLLAVAFISFFGSVVLFVFLPMLEMSKGRSRR